MAKLNRRMQLELMAAGMLDTQTYRYRLLSGGRVQRLPRKYLGTTVERYGWEDVGYLSI